MAGWSGGFAGLSRPDPGPSGAAFWLRSPTGILACHSAERIGRRSRAQAESIALEALVGAARRHKASPLLIHGREPRDDTILKQVKGLRLEFTGASDGEAEEMAGKLFPPPPAFGPDGLVPVGESIYLAKGSRDYYVDVLLGTCTCPAFSFGRRPCKHLIAAEKMGASGHVRTTA